MLGGTELLGVAFAFFFFLVFIMVLFSQII